MLDSYSVSQPVSQSVSQYFSEVQAVMSVWDLEGLAKNCFKLMKNAAINIKTSIDMTSVFCWFGFCPLFRNVCFLLWVFFVTKHLIFSLLISPLPFLLPSLFRLSLLCFPDSLGSSSVSRSFELLTTWETQYCRGDLWSALQGQYVAYCTCVRSGQTDETRRQFCVTC